MGRPSNIDKEMLKHSFPIKERIFNPQFDYIVGKKVSDFWFDDDSLYIEITLSNLQKSIFKLQILENGIFHLQYFQKQISKKLFDEHLNLQLKKARKIIFQADNQKIVVALKNGEQLLFWKQPFQLELRDASGQIKFQTSDREGYEFFEGFITPPIGFRVDGEKIKPFMGFEIQNDELFYGLGEKFRPLVKNGVESVVFNGDNSCVTNNDLAYNGLPLIYSTKNWGVLVNTGSKTTWEIGAPATDQLAFLSDDQFLDLYFLTANSIKEMITQYTDLTGRIQRIPDIGYGIWLNRLYYHNKSELFTEIKNSKKTKFPIDVIALDPKWLKDRYVKSCNFEYNDLAFGDFKTLFQEVGQEKMAMCFWINPYIQSDNANNWNYLFENDLLVKTTDGGLAHPWTGTEVYQENNYLIDFSNPKAFAWYKAELKKLFSLGLRFIKPDYGDGLPENALLYNKKTGSEFKQYYIYLYTKCCYEASVEFFGQGQAITLKRPGYIGTQKFVGKWSGDSSSSFSDLKNHLQAGLSLAMSGEVLWGTDITGFKGTKNLTNDLYNRWTQFGMLTPFSRYHAIGPREPWYFDQSVFKNACKFAHLKKQLLPHYKIFEFEALKTGVPIFRAMVLENQNDVVAQKIDDQFYLGDNLLVAPILTPNTLKRQVYLPKGQWSILGQKEKIYEGQKLYEFPCLVDEILIFVKHGTFVVYLKEGNYSFSELEQQTLLISEYGKVDQKFQREFFLAGKPNKISYKDKKIVVESKLKFEII